MTFLYLGLVLILFISSIRVVAENYWDGADFFGFILLFSIGAIVVPIVHHNHETLQVSIMLVE